MALSYGDIRVELREISLKNRPQELYQISQKGTVPVLIISDDLVIDESLEIMLWVIANHEKNSWMSEDLSKELNLIDLNDNIFKKWLDMYKYHDRYPKHSRQYYRKECDKILYEYENRLITSNFFLKNDISMADVAIFPFIRQYANVDYDWFSGHYKHLELWLEKIVSSKLFTTVMNKYSEWDPNQKPLIINFND